MLETYKDSLQKSPVVAAFCKKKKIMLNLKNTFAFNFLKFYLVLLLEQNKREALSWKSIFEKKNRRFLFRHVFHSGAVHAGVQVV